MKLTLWVALLFFHFGAYGQTFSWGIKTGLAIDKFLPDKASQQMAFVRYRAVPTPLLGLYMHYVPKKSLFDLMLGTLLKSNVVRTNVLIGRGEDVNINRQYLSVQMEAVTGLRFTRPQAVNFRPYIGIKLAMDRYSSTGTSVGTLSGGSTTLDIELDEEGSRRFSFYPMITTGVDIVPKLRKKVRFALMLEYNFAPGALYSQPIAYSLKVYQTEIPISGAFSYFAINLRWFLVRASRDVPIPDKHGVN